MGMVLKTQLKKAKPLPSMSRFGSLLCWGTRSVLCVALVCCGNLPTGWAQLPVDEAEDVANSGDATTSVTTPNDATPKPMVVPESVAREPEISLIDLGQLSDASREVLAATSDAVVSLDGGSGVIVSEDGWVMTASHVCQRPGRRVQVRLANGVQWPAKTYGVDLEKDAGMVKLLGDHVWPFVSIDHDAKVELGDWCVVMGYPWEVENLKTPAVRLGRVTAISDDRIVTDIPIIGGDSGGPVFNTSGDLVAINSRIRLDVHQNIHVPLSTFVDQINTLTRAEFVRAGGFKEKEAVDSSSTKKFGRDSLEVQQAVAEVVAKIKPSIVRLVAGTPNENQVELLGTIVSDSGLVVAKESDLTLPMKAKIGEEWVEVELVGSGQKSDLALLRLMPKADMKFVPIQEVANLIDNDLVGQLILSVTKSSEDARLKTSLGTIMVAPQAFDQTVARQQVDLGLVLDSVKGKLGQSFKPTSLGIARVYPESLAAKAGFRNGDRLVSIDGRDVVDKAELRRILSTLAGGQKVRFSILRQGELRSFRAVLPSPLPLVWDRWGGGPFSGRRFGFGTVIAHDSVIDPSDCGAPVVDLAGNFIGINISRAMRTTTYAVPAKEVQRLVDKYQESQ